MSKEKKIVTCNAYDLRCGYGRCSGTRELERCNCGGNKILCDFYEHRRAEGKEELRKAGDVVSTSKLKTERLTLGGWRLNAARILDRLIDVIHDNGGYLVERAPFIETTDVFLIKNENEPGSPQYFLRTRTYVSFVKNDRYIYVQLGENPFMDCFYIKELVSDGTVSRQPEGRELPWDWFKGDDNYAYMTDREIGANATSLFEWLCDAQRTQEKPTKARSAIRRKGVSDGE